MNMRLAAIQEQAAVTGVQASKVAMISTLPAETEAALALGRCASKLAAWAAKAVSLGDFDGPDRQFVAGQIVERPDFAELDDHVRAFLGLVASSRQPPGTSP